MPKSDTQWKKGQSGNPSGRPKAIVSIVELARAQTEELDQNISLGSRQRSWMG